MNDALLFPTFGDPEIFGEERSSFQTGNLFYNNTPKINKSDYKVYFDNELSELIGPGGINGLNALEEAVIYSNRYSETFDDIKVTLFASTNGVTILQQYDEVKPAS
ncbi:MAG: hypothetical protein AAF193_00995, partial [Bacteroidota bacterium]